MGLETVDRVGLGVDLAGGPEVIKTLRELRQEMQAIAGLASSVPRNIGGQQAAYRDPRQQTLNFREESNKQLELFGDIERKKTEIQRRGLNERERDYVASQRRIANERVKAEKTVGPITQKDIDYGVAAKQRSAALKEAIDAKIERQEIDRQARITRAQEREEKLRTSNFEEQNRIRRNRVAAEANPLNPNRGLTQRIAQGIVAESPGLSSPEDYRRRLAEVQYQARLLQRARNDPAAINDPATLAARRETGAELIALREMNRKMESENAVHYERQLLQYREYRARLASEISKGVPEKLDAEESFVRQMLRGTRGDVINRSDPGTQELRDETAARLRASRIARDRRVQAEREAEVRSIEEETVRNRLFQDVLLNRPTQEEAISPIRGRRDESVFSPFGPLARRQARRYVPPTEEIVPVGQERISAEEFRRSGLGFGQSTRGGFRLTEPPPPSGPRPPAGPVGPLPPRPPESLYNEKGFFTSTDALGRITRNILLYEVISRATYGLAQYTQEAVTSAKASIDLAEALRFTSEQAGRTSTQTANLVESLRPLGQSRQEAQKTAIEATRFAENRPQDIDKLSQIVTNIAASRGIGIDKADELVEQLRRRESKFYKRIFGRTVESIYQEEAINQIRENPFGGQAVIRAQGNPLIKGQLIESKGRNYLTEEDQINKYVANMDDAAKETAVLNYILSQQGKFADEAARRTGTLAGKLDLAAAAFADAKENAGLFILDLKTVNELVTSLTDKASVFGNLKVPTLQDTGQFTRDAEKYAQEKVYGPRAKALDTVDSFFTPTNLLGLTGTAAVGLFGRGRAREQVRSRGFQNIYEQVLPEFEGNANAAKAEAFRQAQQLKPGIIKSVGAGMERITVGMTTGIADLAASAAQAVGAKSLADKATLFSARASGNIVQSVPRDVPFNPVNAYTRSGEPIVSPFSPYDARIIRGPYSSLAPGQGQYTGNGGVYGGLLGGALGGTIGNLVASSINAGPITATVLTVTGSVVGVAAGTAVGQTVGSALTGAASRGLGGIGVGLGSLAAVGAVAALVTDKVTGDILASSEKNLQREEELSRAFAKQAPEIKQAFTDGLIQLRVKATGTVITPEQRAALPEGHPGRLTIDKYDIETRTTPQFTGQYNAQGFPIFTEKPVTAGRTPLQEAQLAERNALEKQIQELPDYRKEQARQNLKVQQDLELQDSLGYTKNLQERKAQFEEEKLREREKLLAKVESVSNIDARLRIPQEIASGLTGGTNAFVKPLAEQSTLLLKTTEQWGFLGDAMVQYFTKLEQKAINIELIKAQFGSLTSAIDLRNKAERERDTYFGPGYSTRQNLVAGAFSAQAQGIGQLSGLNLLDRILGPQRSLANSIKNQTKDAAFQIEQLKLARDRAISQGGNRQQILDLYSKQVTSVATSLDPDAFKFAAGRRLRPDIREAEGLQREAIARNIDDEYRKASIQGLEDLRLKANLADAENQRKNLISRGFDPKDVGAQLDKYILGRTDNIPVKDLSLEQFQQRQGALQRESERAVQQEQEARAAVQQGLKLQTSIEAEVRAIKEHITGVKGDGVSSTKLSVSIQNTTQARVESENLQNSGTRAGKDKR